MFNICLKVYKPCKEIGKYGPYQEDKKTANGTVPDVTQMLDLLDKNFKSAIINIFTELKKT